MLRLLTEGWKPSAPWRTTHGALPHLGQFDLNSFLLPNGTMPVYKFVALATGIFQARAVVDFDFTTVIADEPRPSEESSGDRDTGPTCAQHVGKEFVREWNHVSS